MRRGFSLIYAIFVLVLMSTIMLYSLKTSAQDIKVSTDEHIRAQMRLYAQSAIELGTLWLSGDQARSSAESDLNITFDDNYFFFIHFTPLQGAVSIEDSNGTVLADIIGKTPPSDINYTITQRLLIKP